MDNKSELIKCPSCKGRGYTIQKRVITRMGRPKYEKAFSDCWNCNGTGHIKGTPKKRSKFFFIAIISLLILAGIAALIYFLIKMFS